MELKFVRQYGGLNMEIGTKIGGLLMEPRVKIGGLLMEVVSSKRGVYRLHIPVLILNE